MYSTLLHNYKPTPSTIILIKHYDINSPPTKQSTPNSQLGEHKTHEAHTTSHKRSANTAKWGSSISSALELGIGGCLRSRRLCDNLTAGSGGDDDDTTAATSTATAASAAASTSVDGGGIGVDNGGVLSLGSPCASGWRGSDYRRRSDHNNWGAETVEKGVVGCVLLALV